MKTPNRRKFISHITLTAEVARTLDGHHQNFINCIRHGKRSRADIEIGHLSSSLCHLGNIAIRTGENAALRSCEGAEE